MFTKINHLAIISENYTAAAKFYEVMFGMRTSAKTKTERAMSVGDGYVGLTSTRAAPAARRASIISGWKSRTSRTCLRVCARAIRR